MPFQPEKIISSGQTGAAIGGLIAARKAGIATGGWAPLGFNTEKGPQPDTLISSYKLEEYDTSEFADLKNIVESDATVLFTKDPKSQSSLLIVKACDNEGRRYIVIRPGSVVAQSDLRAFLERIQPNELNVTGDTESQCPGIEEEVQDLLHSCLID